MMPTILSVAEVIPPFEIKQEQAMDFARGIFTERFKDIERLLKAFQNGQIEKDILRKILNGLKRIIPLRKRIMLTLKQQLL